jgi:4-amino-4-deoxy-L-arabinose transferase-like glycosyltransferase
MGRKSIPWRWIALTAWCGFLFFYGLSGPLYRTEALRAIIGRSALEGHWLTPTLYGEPFLTKPPGMYAAIGLASLPFGDVTEESARLPSAIAGVVAVLFAFATLRRVLDEQRAFVAALLLPVSFLWLEKVPSAEIDLLLVAWVVGALLAFLRAVLARDEGRHSTSTAWWFAALVCVAGGFLTKWTAPAFFYLAVGPFLVWTGRARWLVGRDHLLAVAVAVGLCTVWAWRVSVEVGWDSLRDTVALEAAQRFAPKSRGKPYPWLESLTFPALVLGANLPWSVPALLALRPRFLRSLDSFERTLVQLLHCWVWPNLLFWSLPAQHNVRYVLPITPAITLLGVIYLLKWTDTTVRPLAVSRRTLLIGCLLTWAVVKLAYVEAIVPTRTADRNARQTGEELARLVPAGDILYLCRLKDEGVLFYYARPARRFDPESIPKGVAVHAVLLDAEWATEAGKRRSTHLTRLRDQQGAPIHLVRIQGPTEDDARCPRPPSIPPTSSPSAP